MPKVVPIERVTLLGAATDWYVVSPSRGRLAHISQARWIEQGLRSLVCNPSLAKATMVDVNIRDTQYYMGVFRSLCVREKMHELKWPERDYIVQVARFDPSKGKKSEMSGCVNANVHNRYT